MKDDFQTNTVDGAAGFQRAYNSERDYDSPSRRELANEAAAEEFKKIYGSYPEDMTDEELQAIEDGNDSCTCSDPGCPCSGFKKPGYWL